MRDYSIGKRKFGTTDDNFPSHDKILEFQNQYIDVWKSAYCSALTAKRIIEDSYAKEACDKFFENFGRPNRLYFTHKEFNIIKQDIEDNGV